MSSQRISSTKSTKPPPQNPSNQPPPSRSSSSSSSSFSVSSHLAMVEMKQRILTSLSKLSDRDTHQIVVDDLEKITQTLSPEGIPMLLNCLYDASATDPKPAVKKESLSLLTAVCAAHSDAAAAHLTKIISHVVRKLKDTDSVIRDACRDAIGALSGLYFKGSGNGGSGENAAAVVGLFVRLLLEAMGEQSKGVQSCAALLLFIFFFPLLLFRFGVDNSKYQLMY